MKLKNLDCRDRLVENEEKWKFTQPRRKQVVNTVHICMYNTIIYNRYVYKYKYMMVSGWCWVVCYKGVVVWPASIISWRKVIWDHDVFSSPSWLQHTHTIQYTLLDCLELISAQQLAIKIIISVRLYHEH